MAKASANTKLVTVTKQEEKVVGVTLDLNKDELYTLALILNKLGGFPDNSLRRHSISILDAITPYVRREAVNWNIVNKVMTKESTGIMFNTGSVDWFEKEEIQNG